MVHNAKMEPFNSFKFKAVDSGHGVTGVSVFHSCFSPVATH